MAVILQMTYLKKLGLPNFNSHSCSVSVTTEIPDVSVVAQESTKLYSLLQTAKQRWIWRFSRLASCGGAAGSTLET